MSRFMNSRNTFPTILLPKRLLPPKGVPNNPLVFHLPLKTTPLAIWWIVSAQFFMPFYLPQAVLIWLHCFIIFRARRSNYLLILSPYLLRKKVQEFSKGIVCEPELARKCSESWTSGKSDRQIDKYAPHISSSHFSPSLLLFPIPPPF